MSRVWGCLMACLLLMACTGADGLLPPSGGRLYEVLLVGDREGLVRQMLEKDVEGLPQSEPSFDVSAIDSTRFDASVRQARNIVMVTIDPKAYDRPHVGYEKNVWAKPQIVVLIGAPSVSALRQGAQRVGTTLRTLLVRAEANKTLALLRHKRNNKAEQMVRQMFGVSIWIPMDMVASKRGKDFIWLSDNGTAIMQNIVIYREQPLAKGSDRPLTADDDSVQSFVAQRDRVLGQNIKGETDSMWMATLGPSVSRRLVFRDEKERALWLRHNDAAHAPMTLFRGLWEMRGDDMGGPFVSRRLPVEADDKPSKVKCGSVVAEGFVFAPGKTKRNAIRRLETVLYTLKWDKPGKKEAAWETEAQTTSENNKNKHIIIKK